MKVYKRILEKKKILSSYRPLNKLQLNRLKQEFLDTLTLNETRLLLEEGITISGKSLREHLDATNQKQAIEWIEEFTKKNIREIDILMLHKLTLKGISDYWAGKYKTSQNRIIGSKLKTTPPYKVKSEMGNLVYLINKNPQKYNTIELAAFSHHELVRIHPFVDGNGRTARLISNLILINRGFPPVIIRNIDRKKYFDCLEKAHFGNLKPFADFIALRLEESLIRYLNSFVKTTKSNELLPLSVLAKETPYSQEYLSLLARKGTLPATKIDGVWHTSRDEIKKYMKAIKQP